jgi:hypothetical protein
VGTRSTARLRHQACIEDVDYRAARGLDRALFLKLAQCSFIEEHANSPLLHSVRTIALATICAL